MLGVVATLKVKPGMDKQFEAVAREQLAPAYYDFFAGGAQDEITLRDNEAAFGRLACRSRKWRINVRTMIMNNAANPPRSRSLSRPNNFILID